MIRLQTKTIAGIIGAFLSLAGLSHAAELDNAAADAAAGAQVDEGVYYRWIDDMGRVQYSDYEPDGFATERVELVPEPTAAGTMILEPAGNTEAGDQDDQILPIEHIGPCADARRDLAILHSAVPVYRTTSGSYRSAWRDDNYQGSREMLDADSRMAAIELARQEVATACADPAAFEREMEAFEARMNR